MTSVIWAGEPFPTPFLICSHIFDKLAPDSPGEARMRTGQCHCGGVRYALEGEPMHHTLCHCSDCRRHAGAPMVGWAMFKSEQVKVTQGEAKAYASSETGRRHFCADCGTGLFYT